MPKQVFSNNAETTLAAALGSGDSSFTVADGSAFQTPSGGDYELITIAEGSTIEIIKCQSRSGNVFSSLTRAQEGTSAGTFTTAATVSGRVTSGTLARLLQTDQDEFACGINATAVGTDACSYGRSAKAPGARAGAFSHSADADGNDSLAAGSGAWAAESNSLALGTFASVLAGGDKSAAIGYSATAAVPRSIVFAGLPMVRDTVAWADSDPLLYYAAPEVVIMSAIVNLKTLADNVVSLTLPSGCKFFPDEVGLVLTSVSAPGTQPDVSFGISGNTTALLASTTTTKNTAGARERYKTLVTDDGQTTLTASVKAAATGTTFSGRFYFKGLVVQDE